MKKLMNSLALVATAMTGMTVAAAPAAAQRPTYAQQVYGVPGYDHDRAMRQAPAEQRAEAAVERALVGIVVVRVAVCTAAPSPACGRGLG